MDKIKLAVLGLNQGSKIARDAKANPEIELVAVAGFGDHDVKVAEELGVPLYNDYTLLLKQEDLDAVAIALPNTPCSVHRVGSCRRYQEHLAREAHRKHR